MTRTLLSTSECARAVSLYATEELFRSRIVMERYAFGRGEYKYFKYPLPDVVQELRAALYPELAPVANRSTFAARNVSTSRPAT